MLWDFIQSFKVIEMATLQSLMLLMLKATEIHFIFFAIIYYNLLHVSYGQGRKLADFITFGKQQEKWWFYNKRNSSFQKVNSRGAKPKLHVALKNACSSKKPHTIPKKTTKTPQAPKTKNSPKWQILFEN